MIHSSNTVDCDHICTSDCRRVGCNCLCGEFHCPPEDKCRYLDEGDCPNHPNERASWMEEFDELCERGFADNRYTGKANYSRLKIYITNLLISEREKMAKEVGGLKRERDALADVEGNDTAELYYDRATGYNEAIEVIAALIRKEQ